MNADIWQQEGKPSVTKQSKDTIFMEDDGCQ